MIPFFLDSLKLDSGERDISSAANLTSSESTCKLEQAALSMVSDHEMQKHACLLLMCYIGDPGRSFTSQLVKSVSAVLDSLFLSRQLRFLESCLGVVLVLAGNTLLSPHPHVGCLLMTSSVLLFVAAYVPVYAGAVVSNADLKSNRPNP